MSGEGIKHDEGKPDWSLIPPDAVEEIVKVYGLGVRKYGRDNWRKGLKFSRIFSAIMRHLWAWWRGENEDKESGLSHLAHAAWGCLTLMEYEGRIQYLHFDDRVTDKGATIVNSDGSVAIRISKSATSDSSVEAPIRVDY